MNRLKIDIDKIDVHVFKKYSICTHKHFDYMYWDHKELNILYQYIPNRTLESYFLVIYDNNNKVCTQYYDTWEDILQDGRVKPYIEVVTKFKEKIEEIIENE